MKIDEECEDDGYKSNNISWINESSLDIDSPIVVNPDFLLNHTKYIGELSNIK